MQHSRIIRRLPAVLVLAAGLLGLSSPHAFAANNGEANGDAVARADLISRIENVPANAQFTIRDNTGATMDVLKVIQVGPRDYLAVYHSLQNGVFQVRLDRSTDLRTWTYVGTLDNDAAEPYLAKVPGGSFVLAEEKDEPPPTSFVHIRFLQYANLGALLNGTPDKTFDAPRTLSGCFEGTPDIEDADASSLTVGFHYAENCDTTPFDQEAEGTLTNFDSWTTTPLTAENQAMNAAGFIGKHGDRDFIVWDGHPFRLLEAQNSTDATSFSNWRLLLYDLTNGKAYPVVPKAPLGSTYSLANPTLTLVTGPTGKQLLVVGLYNFTGTAEVGAGPMLYAVPATGAIG